MNIEEWYDILAIALCNAAETFDENRSKFATYASKCMSYAVCKELQLQEHLNRKVNKTTYSYEEKIKGELFNRDDATVQSILPNTFNTESEAITNVIFLDCYNQLCDRDKVGYPVGTFKLGQKIYHIMDKKHSFKFHKKCEYCDNTGYVSIKGRKFICPACKGEYTYKEIIEKIIDDYDIKIGSIITFQNKKGFYECYAIGSEGYGLQIHKCDDGSNMYFGTKEKAEEVCKKFNKEHNVDLYLEEYARASIKENINDEF